jgi:hypothetical protein
MSRSASGDLDLTGRFCIGYCEFRTRSMEAAKLILEIP